METLTPHKRGDSYSRRMKWENEDGSAVNLTGFAIASQIRVATGVLLAELTGTPDDQSITNTPDVAGRGWFTLEPTDPDTTGWEPGQYVSDVQFTSPGGVISSSPTFGIEIAADVTRAD